MSYQTTNYITVPILPNSYITKKLNNIEEVKIMKKKRNNWMKNYHKTLKGSEVMIDMQKQVKDIMKIAAEANMTITEMKETILKASINNQVINTTNITGVSEDLRYLIQSDMENHVFQVQRMLADELDAYKGRENMYVNDNIWDIQELFKEEEIKKEGGRIEDKEVILVKSYEISQFRSLTLSSTTSFIIDEVDNLLKYMKFV